MGDYLWAGKRPRYVTATEVNLAFYTLWHSKMSIIIIIEWYTEYNEKNTRKKMHKTLT